MEICLAQDWGSLESAELAATVKFQPGCASLDTVGGRCLTYDTPST
jgi:hypothetical protein